VTTKTKKPAQLSLKDAFEAEYAKRQAERRARDEAERKQQEQDLANAEALHAAVSSDGDFLANRGLTADLRRYTVSLDHAAFRIATYFDGGSALVTSADKRTSPGAAPRRQETVESVEDALRIMAQFLADETR
jgi:phosphate-selective porin